MTKRDAYLLVLRYILLFLVSLGNLKLIYLILTPLTVYPVFWLLSLFTPATLTGIVISIPGNNIYLVESCISGAAYFLLLILNLTTSMTFKKRVLSLVFSFSLFLIINVLRILVFSLLIASNFSLFNIVHLIFWYILSSLIVVFAWILTIKLFKIKEIPVYDDLKFLCQRLKLRT